MLAIVFASHQPRLPSPEGIPFSDKFAHFGAYGLMATLWVRAFSATTTPGRAAMLGWLIASLFGVTDEFHQSFVPGRSTEVADWVADTSGAALAAVIYRFWPAYRRLMEVPVVNRPGDEVAAAAAVSDQRS